MKIAVIASVGLLAAFASCSPALAPDAAWDGKKWVLYEINGTPVQLSGTNKDAHIVFASSDKKINGSGGCNRINGPYEIGKTKLVFGEIAGTKMLCNDQAFENNFLTVLKTVNKYSVEDGVLLLKKNKNTVLRFR